MTVSLPIHDLLPDFIAYMAKATTAILIAPPGAGKTTGVPLGLLSIPWLTDQRLIMLEPRRLAASSAAQRMAQTLGDGIGETIGFRVRGETKISPKTRVEVVTEGIFLHMILNDPSLEGIGGVIFDEFHERSMDADLSLALARDSQTILRPDLRLIVMSATLDGERVKSILPEAEIFQSMGRSFPVSTYYLGRDQALTMERDMAGHIARLAQKLAPDKPETLLVFLPGQGEIHKLERDLEALNIPDFIDIQKLYGAMEYVQQMRVLAPIHGPRIVLATAIAETSLTLESVTMVIDSGLSRQAKFDPGSGQSRLVTQRVSRAAADQRRGRAGRTQAGAAYRLWDVEQDRALIPFARPEILEADLSNFVLSLKLWGAKDTLGLALLDHPPKAAFSEAVALLVVLGALDAEGQLTQRGRVLAKLPLPPRLGHMLIKACQTGQSEVGARLCALLSENGAGGIASDLETRLQVLQKDRSQRAALAVRLAKTWVKQVETLIGPDRQQPDKNLKAAHLLAEIYPDRIAKARGKSGEFLMANGRGVYVEAHDPLAAHTYLAVADLGGGARRDRILLAAPLDEAFILRRFQHHLTTEVVMEGQRAIEETRLGGLVLKSRPLDKIPRELMGRISALEIKQKGLSVIRFNDEALNFRARVEFLRGQGEALPDMSDAALLEGLEDWLSPLAGAAPLNQLEPQTVLTALRQRLSYEQNQKLERSAPQNLLLPAGNHATIDYSSAGGPRVEVRVQALYGLKVHPCVGPKSTPLTLALTSPAHRPLQITQNLPAFWEGTWAEVRREMKGRYPRHLWPENPRLAAPTLRAKPKGT
jgi:ATP-dependent helicase HrpB